MKNTKFLILIFFSMSVYFATNGQTIRVLPLGNSITQSDDAHLSYRYPLWTKLLDAGADFDYVGSLTANFGGTPVFPPYNGQTFDQDHEGHWGWRADQILDDLSGWVAGYTPDIALIHLGTNDLYQEGSSPEVIDNTIDEIKDIIAVLRTDNPTVTILVAQLIPSTHPSLISSIPFLNAAIPQIATDLNTIDSPVIIVDQYSGYDPVADNQSDGVHPNETGEEKMAQKWFDAMLPFLNLSGSIELNLNLFLEGPFLETDMVSSSATGLLPASQPFDQEPWNYSGTEIASGGLTDITDWVLIELRDAASVETADGSSIISQQACLVDKSGFVRDVEGNQNVVFPVQVSDDLFVVVYHRNHLPVISANPLSFDGYTYSYDFTQSGSSAWDGDDILALLPNGAYALKAGDINADGTIDETDIQINWMNNAGEAGYLGEDTNLDGVVDNADKNGYIVKNFNSAAILP